MPGTGLTRSFMTLLRRDWQWAVISNGFFQPLRIAAR